MKFHVTALLPLLASLLAGCSTNVTVKTPMIAPTDLGSQDKTPGHYAVWLQSGAWKSTIEAKGFAGSACTFPTDFDSAYQQAARSTFQTSFEAVNFTSGPLKPDELKAQNFDAQIIVYQGSIKGTFSVIQGFWANTIDSNVNMDGIVAVIGHEGLASQGTANGRGNGTNKPGAFEGGCGTVTNAIMQAGSFAIKDFVVNSVNIAKMNVMENKQKIASSQFSK